MIIELWNLGKYLPDPLHVKLLLPIIQVDAILLLLHISELGIAIPTYVFKGKQGIGKGLKPMVELFQALW